MSHRALGSGLALAAIAALVAGAVIHWGPSIVLGMLPALLGDRAGDQLVVEFLFNASIFGALIAAAAIGGAAERRNALAMGDRPGRGAVIGLAIGFGGISVAAGYAAVAGTLIAGPANAVTASGLLLGACAVGVQAVGEEAYFRGWVQPGLVRRWGVVAGLVATTALFAGLHVLGGARAPLSIVNLFLGGLAFGLLALRGRGLAGAAAFHFGWNATEQLVWGLDPNPGVSSFGSVTDKDLVGSTWWGGAPEGLNASLAMTFVLLAVLIPLARATWRSAALRRERIGA